MSRIPFQRRFFVAFLLPLVGFTAPAPSRAQTSPITVTVLTSGSIPQYNRFEAEVRFTTTAANPYWPYDTTPPSGVPSGTGVTVDALLLPPGQSNWGQARKQPCFYYQPMQEVGGALMPAGSPVFRLRFAPEQTGSWRFKVRVTDAQGTRESAEQGFSCAAAASRGFVGVSTRAPEQFEYADRTPFVTPLVSGEGLFAGLADQRSRIAQLGGAGARFTRWWLTARGSNYCAPFGGSIAPAWEFSGQLAATPGPAPGSRFSWAVTDSNTRQTVPVQAGVTYKLSTFVRVASGAQIRLRLSTESAAGVQTVVSDTGGAWQEKTLVFAPGSGQTLTVDINRPDGNTTGTALFSDARLQISRDGGATFEPGNGLERGNADTFMYVDQRAAARADDLFAVSETNNVFHKITLTDKDDPVLGNIAADGGTSWGADNAVYAADNTASRWFQQAWWRYFNARFTPFRSVHSLEFCNEADPYSGIAQAASLAFAGYFRSNCVRNAMPITSFWHSFNRGFWSRQEFSYGDVHEYVGPAVSGTESSGDKFWWGLATRGDNPIWYGDSVQRIEVINGEGRGGGRGFKVTSLSPGTSVRRTEQIAYFGGVPGRTYRIKVWSRGVNLQNNANNPFEGTNLTFFATQGYTSENDTEAGGWQPGIALRCGVPPANESYVVASQGWTEYTGEITMNGNKEILGLRLDSFAAPGMTLWYDDIRVYAVDSAGTETLVWRMDFDEPLITADSALDVRAYWFKFAAFSLGKPVVRGESGLRGAQTQAGPVAFGGQTYAYTGEDQALIRDSSGVYYRKKLWAHLGCPGFYDGQWWTDNLVKKNLWGLYGTYERFLSGEPVSDGTWCPVGTDLEGDRALSATGGLRAWGRRSGDRVLVWVDNPTS